MTKTSLEIANKVLKELGRDPIKSLDSAGNAQLKGVIDREYTLLSGRAYWVELIREKIIKLEPKCYVYDMPTDSHQILELSINAKKLIGPVTGYRYRELIESNAKPGTPVYYIITKTHRISITPVPNSNYDMLVKYIVKSDVDCNMLDTNLLYLGSLWRFKKDLGFDWQDDCKKYESLVVKAIKENERKTMSLKDELNKLVTDLKEISELEVGDLVKTKLKDKAVEDYNKRIREHNLTIGRI